MDTRSRATISVFEPFATLCSNITAATDFFDSSLMVTNCRRGMPGAAAFTESAKTTGLPGNARSSKSMVCAHAKPSTIRNAAAMGTNLCIGHQSKSHAGNGGAGGLAVLPRALLLTF